MLTSARLIRDLAFPLALASGCRFLCLQPPARAGDPRGEIAPLRVAVPTDCVAIGGTDEHFCWQMFPRRGRRSNGNQRRSGHAGGCGASWAIPPPSSRSFSRLSIAIANFSRNADVSRSRRGN